MSEFKSILEGLGYNLRDCSKGWRAKPLYRESDNDSILFIDRETGSFCDFKTKTGGSFEKLVKLSKGELTEDDVKNIEAEKTKNQTRLRRSKVYDFDFKLLNKLKKDYYYYTSKGISEKTLETFKAGVATSGDLRGRIVFPIIQYKKNLSDKLIGFSGRDTTFKSKIKWIHIGDSDKWNYPLFLNKKYILESREIILVESIGNLIKLWDLGIKNAMCCFGSRLSKGCFKTILQFSVKKVTISFDNDKPDRSGKRAGQEGADLAKKTLGNFLPEENIFVKLPPKEGQDIFEMEDQDIYNLYGKQN